MSWFSNLIGDVTKGVEEVVPGAKQIDQWLNKAGIGPQDIAHPFQSPGGWAGDIEHGFSQATHDPQVRQALEMAAMIAASVYAPELIGSFAGDFSAADMEAIAQAGSEYAAEGTAATSYGADLAAETASAGTEIPSAAADAAAAAPGAAAAAPGAAAPGSMQELAVQASRLPGAFQGGQGLYASTNMLPFAAAASAPLLAQQPTTGPQSKDVTRGDQGASDQPVAPGDPGAYGAPPPTTPDLSGFPQVGGPAAGALDPTMQAIQDLGAQDLADQAMIESGDPEMYQAMNQAGTGFGGPGWLQSLANYATSGKGLLTEGMLGASLLTGLSKPKIPDAAKQAGAEATQAAAQAEQVIASGGRGTQIWGQQKAAIDASIDQQIQNYVSAVQQNAQNSGQGGANSAAVQAQMANVTSQLETQRQLLYAQALQQNINNAVAELSGGDQVLMGIANMQLQQSQEARAQATQLAGLAAWLNVASG